MWNFLRTIPYLTHSCLNLGSGYLSLLNLSPFPKHLRDFYSSNLKYATIVNVTVVIIDVNVK